MGQLKVVVTRSHTRGILALYPGMDRRNALPDWPRIDTFDEFEEFDEKQTVRFIDA